MNLDEAINLANLLQNISLDDNDNLDSESLSSESQNMAQAVDYQLLRLHLDSIPQYDGNPHTLSIFVQSCDNFLIAFGNAENVILNNVLIRSILSKLTGRALTLIGSRSELSTWDDVKKILKLSFGDQRNIDCLIQDLISLCPNRNETSYNFGIRCQDARSLVLAKLNSLEGITAEEKDIRIKSYDDLALKTYIRGLTGNIQTNVRLRNPENLETAMSLVIEEENFLYYTNRTNPSNFQINSRPMPRVIPTRNNTYHQDNQRNVTEQNRQSNLPRFSQQRYFSNFTNQNNNNTFNPRQSFATSAPRFQNQFRNDGNQSSVSRLNHFPRQDNLRYNHFAHQNNALPQRSQNDNYSRRSNTTKPEPMEVSYHLNSMNNFSPEINHTRFQPNDHFSRQNPPLNHEDTEIVENQNFRLEHDTNDQR